MDLQPELLLHPNIPKALHGINPRTIKGDVWWNQQRQQAYRQNNYKCWACGIDKVQAKYHKWLEAHEMYNINYLTGSVTFTGICALCHSCHNFIHSGRLVSLFRKNEIDLVKIKDILQSGFDILVKNKLSMNPFALVVAKEVALPMFFNYSKYKIHKYNKCNIEWNDWRLIIDNKEYKGKFNSLKEWNSHYNK